MTAFAHTLKATSGPNHNVTELDISRPEGDRLQPYVPRLTDEEPRHAATFVSTDGSAYVCWLYLTYGHAMYMCPFLSPEQRQFTAYRNYCCQMETRPGMRNLVQQSTREDRGPQRGDPNRSGGGVRFAPREGGYRYSGADQRDRRDPRQMDTRYPWRDGRGDRAVPSCLQRYRTPSCTFKIGLGIRTRSPQKEAEESLFSPPLKYYNGPTLQFKDTKSPITS